MQWALIKLIVGGTEMAWAQRVIELIDKGLQEWLDEIINVARIPAPVFEEGERSQYIYISVFKK